MDDDLADLAFAWPSWKFGMKRGDLFTTLHDKYNTFSSTIQDPEAFHHDVYEIASEARTEDEFHRLLADRRQQRLDEMNECLESASLEIIANPKLIGTEQWSFALQLFRTRSLDSLVRYFSSYLPEGYLDRHGFHQEDDAASTVSSFTDGCSVQSESTNMSSLGDADVHDEDDVPSLFTDDEAPAVATREPLRRIATAFKTSPMKKTGVVHDLPPSPRSMTSGDDSASPTDDERHDDDFPRRFTPARSMSFSGSDSDCFGGREAHLTDDESAMSVAGSSATSVSDAGDHGVEDDYESFDTAQYDDMFETVDTIIDSIESDIATPKPEPTSITTHATPCYLDAARAATTPSPAHRRRLSPLRDTPTHHQRTPKSALATPVLLRAAALRRSPEEASSRISKPLPDTTRTRNSTRGRRTALD